MRMIMSNLKFGDFEFPDKAAALVNVRNMLNEKFMAHGIKSNMSYDDEAGLLFFDTVDGMQPNRLFLSKEKNRETMNLDDPRRKKLNRDYIETHRLTETQNILLWEDLINGSLNRVGLKCTIEHERMVRVDGGETQQVTVLRNGDNWMAWPFEERYPKETK